MGTWEVSPFADKLARFLFLSAHQPIVRSEDFALNSVLPIHQKHDLGKASWLL